MKTEKRSIYNIAVVITSIAVMLLTGNVLTSCGKGDKQNESNEECTEKATQEETNLVCYPGRDIKYSRQFRDLNEKHLAVAQKLGMNPSPKTRKDAADKHYQLYHIYTNKNYIVEELTHSVPYLMPVASKRLNAIGEEFADILARNGLPHYRFRVTSVLRTQEDITSLQKSGNFNSVKNSAHNYGTTFDIAYTKFDKTDITHDYMTEDNLKLVLGQVLLNQQRAGHIYVKYEYKQACFHVTARD